MWNPFCNNTFGERGGLFKIWLGSGKSKESHEGGKAGKKKFLLAISKGWGEGVHGREGAKEGTRGGAKERVPEREML